MNPLDLHGKCQHPCPLSPDVYVQNAIEKLRSLVEWCNDRPEDLNEKAMTIRELEREFDAAGER